MLDDRLVPSATVLDLTTAGAAASAPSGAIVQQTDAQPTGTGFIRSFVRLQGASSGGGTEQGYNTDGRALQFDENKSPQFTRSLTLDQVPIVNVNGVSYRQFLLDINQKASSPLLSLDEARIFLGGTGNLTGYDTTCQDSGRATLGIRSGQRRGRVRLAELQSEPRKRLGRHVPARPQCQLRQCRPEELRLPLLEVRRIAGRHRANSGFEEWAVKSTPPPVLPPTGSLSGSVVVFDETNPNGVSGIAGVAVHLRGTDLNGDTVVLDAVTDDNGNYTFTNVPMGTYTLSEDMPDGVTVSETAGSLGGTIGSQTDGSIVGISFLDPNNLNGDGYVFVNASR